MRPDKEDQFRLLVQWVSDYAIFLLDPQGRVVSWNKGAQRIKGFSERDVLGKHFSMFFVPEDVEAGRPAAELRLAAKRGETQDEGWKLRKDGSRYWAHNVVTALHDAQGRVIGYGKITRDLTEGAAGRADRALHKIADLVPTIVWVSDPNGKMTYFNPSWTKTTGQPLNEALDTGWTRMVLAEDLPKATEFWREAHLHGEPYERELRLKTAIGGCKWFLIRGVPVRDTEERSAAHFGSIVDIDERVRLSERARRHEAELQAAVAERTKRLKETVAELEGFSYAASHDLRAPLRSIEGYARLLLRDYGDKLDAEGRDRLERLREGAQRMDGLIHDLLAFTVISRGEVSPARLDLDSVLKEAVEHAACGNIQVRGPLGAVQGQRSLLLTAIENLFSNACKFAVPGQRPQVTVWSERGAATTKLWVEDNGIGFDPSLLPKLFRPFARAASADYPGSGIGLAIVKKAVERMGGEVGGDSQPGRGSRFWIELPSA